MQRGKRAVCGGFHLAQRGGGGAGHRLHNAGGNVQHSGKQALKRGILHCRLRGNLGRKRFRRFLQPFHRPEYSQQPGKRLPSKGGNQAPQPGKAVFHAFKIQPVKRGFHFVGCAGGFLHFLANAAFLALALLFFAAEQLGYKPAQQRKRQRRRARYAACFFRKLAQHVRRPRKSVLRSV